MIKIIITERSKNALRILEYLKNKRISLKRIADHKADLLIKPPHPNDSDTHSERF